jgi:Cytochrome P450
VTLAVGEHVRMPRTYRGGDILWWLDASGLLDERYDELPDLVRARSLPSMQLVGSPQRATVDLNSLRRLGVRLVGRLAGVRDGTAQFSGSLTNVCALADLKLGRLLDTVDAWADRTGVGVEHPPQRLAPTDVPSPAALSARLGAGGIATTVWATGFRHKLPWLNAPVFDRKGRVRHDGGVTSRPVPDRPAVLAPPQVHPDRRRRGGRARGHDTTTRLIGNGTVALLRHPEQRDALVADPCLVPGAIEECLRWDAPVPHSTFRYTTEQARLGDVVIPAFAQVIVSLAAANRDPARYRDAESFDINRTDGGHLALGHGIHFCLGAPLARMEARIAFTALHTRFSAMRLAVDPSELHWGHGDGLVVRGLTELPVVLGPATASADTHGVDMSAPVGRDHMSHGSDAPTRKAVWQR